MQVIYRGAEAVLRRANYLDLPVVEKTRKPKSYRLEEIDEKIRAQRAKKEVKMLKKAREKVETPYVLQVDLDKGKITMEDLGGPSLKKTLKRKEENPKEIGKSIGQEVKNLHSLNVVHNDLTTSNMIRKNGKIHFIDFGLAEKSSRTEDKAMDLLVLKKMLKSTHWRDMNEIWSSIKKGYGEGKTLDKLKEIEKRGRYIDQNS